MLTEISQEQKYKYYRVHLGEIEQANSEEEE